MSTYEKYIHQRIADQGLTPAEADAFARDVTGLAFDTAIEQAPQLLLSAMVAKGEDLKWHAARLSGQLALLG